MKKRVVSILLIAAMTASLAAGSHLVLKRETAVLKREAAVKKEK